MKAHFEQPAEPSEEVVMGSLKRLLDAEEERIDDIHNGMGAIGTDKRGIGVCESFSLQPEFMFAVINGDDFLGLEDEEAERYEWLRQLLWKGELNDKGREKEAAEFVEYVSRMFTLTMEIGAKTLNLQGEKLARFDYLCELVKSGEIFNDAMKAEHDEFIRYMVGTKVKQAGDAEKKRTEDI